MLYLGPMHVRLLLTPIPMKAMNMTQKDKILNYLNKSGTITVKEAMIELGIGSLTKRISELRLDGYDIVKRIKVHPVTGAQYASYRLAA